MFYWGKIRCDYQQRVIKNLDSIFHGHLIEKS
jgi:hypothetical protein